MRTSISAGRPHQDFNNDKRERILDVWAKTEIDVATMGERFGMQTNHINVVLSRARAKGDPRVERGHKRRGVQCVTRHALHA